MRLETQFIIFLTLLQTWIKLILPGEWIHQPGYDWKKCQGLLPPVTLINGHFSQQSLWSEVNLPVQTITNISFNVSNISKFNNRGLDMRSNKKTNWGEQREECKSKRNRKCWTEVKIFYRKYKMIKWLLIILPMHHLWEQHSYNITTWMQPMDTSQTNPPVIILSL